MLDLKLYFNENEDAYLQNGKFFYVEPWDELTAWFYWSSSIDDLILKFSQQDFTKDIKKYTDSMLNTKDF